MNKDKKTIWAYLSIKKGTYDNDYYFYEDGAILHHYDRTMAKTDTEEWISPSDISDYERSKILAKCKDECPPEIFTRIKMILDCR